MFNANRSISRTPFRFLLAGLLLGGAALAQQPNQMGYTGAASTLPLVVKQQTQANSTTGGTALTAVPDDFSDLKLAPGFLLDVEVYDEPELSTHVRVDKDGNVSLPFIGSVHVAGKTVLEAEKTLQDKFRKDQILTNPQVSLNVEQYASSSVTVLGEVQNPGRIQMLAPHSLLDVLGLAGGETNLAGKTIEVKTPTKNGVDEQSYDYDRNGGGDAIRGVMVQPGSTVTVDRAGIVYVLGAVNRPGGYVMQEGGQLNVAQALSLALGTSLQAKIKGVRVIRHEPGGQLEDIPVPYRHIMEGKAKPLQLQAEDIVYVPVSKIKAIFTSGGAILGETGAATIYAVR